MGRRTTPTERRTFFELHEQGLSYREIAEQYKVPKECVRNCCRCLRDGGSSETNYHREPTGILSRFDGLVRYCILRLRLQHKKRGLARILYHLEHRESLKGMVLPSPAQIGRYIRQWPKLQREHSKKVKAERPNLPTKVISGGGATSRSTSPCKMGQRLICIPSGSRGPDRPGYLARRTCPTTACFAVVF